MLEIIDSFKIQAKTITKMGCKNDRIKLGLEKIKNWNCYI